MDNFFNRYIISPSQGDIANVTCVHSTISPSQGDIASVTSERRISLDVLAETINGFNELTIQSTINDSAYYDSEEDDAERDPNSDPKVATYITNVNPPHKLFINWLIPDIIPGAIPPIDQTITEDAELIGETFEALQTIHSKEIVPDAARSGARIFRTPGDVSRTDGEGTTP